MTRGQAAAFVWRMKCEPEPATTHGFTDVHASWQQDPVSWLLEHDAAPILGNTDPSDVFGPSTPLTRAQMAGLLYRVEGEPTDGADTELPFTDLTETWQTAPVRWLSHTGITTGTSDTTFAPDRTVSRAEFATFLWRYSDEPAPGDPRCGLPELPERVGEPYVLVPNPDDIILANSNGAGGYIASHPVELQIGSWKVIPETPGFADSGGYRIVVEFKHLPLLSASVGEDVYSIRSCSVRPFLYSSQGINGRVFHRYAVKDADGRWRVEAGHVSGRGAGRGGHDPC